MALYAHNLTGVNLLLKKKYKKVSSFYLLDDNLNKIENGFNCNREKHFKIRICLNKNVTEIK